MSDALFVTAFIVGYSIVSGLHSALQDTELIRRDEFTRNGRDFPNILWPIWVLIVTLYMFWKIGHSLPGWIGSLVRWTIDAFGNRSILRWSKEDDSVRAKTCYVSK